MTSHPVYTILTSRILEHLTTKQKNMYMFVSATALDMVQQEVNTTLSELLEQSKTAIALDRVIDTYNLEATVPMNTKIAKHICSEIYAFDREMVDRLKSIWLCGLRGRLNPRVIRSVVEYRLELNPYGDRFATI